MTYDAHVPASVSGQITTVVREVSSKLSVAPNNQSQSAESQSSSLAAQGQLQENPPNQTQIRITQETEDTTITVRTTVFSSPTVIKTNSCLRKLKLFGLCFFNAAITAGPALIGKFSSESSEGNYFAALGGMLGLTVAVVVDCIAIRCGLVKC